jgi:hypothetical protein
MNKTILLFLNAAIMPLFLAAIPAQAETRDVIQKAFDTPLPAQLAVKADSSAIFVAVWDKPQMEVTITRVVRAHSEAAEKEYLGKDKVDVAMTDGKVTVTLDVPRGGWGSFARRDYRIDIKAPASCSAFLRTNGGPIGVDGLKGSVDAETSGGPVTLGKISGDAKVKTSGGPIRATDCSGRLTAHTSGGGIDLSGAFASIDASTSGGGVNAVLNAQPTGDVTLRTSGGGIHVSLPDTIKAHVDARTSGGNITSEFPMTVSGHSFNSHISGDLNGGGVPITLSTSGGNVHIVKIK